MCVSVKNSEFIRKWLNYMDYCIRVNTIDVTKQFIDDNNGTVVLNKLFSDEIIRLGSLQNVCEYYDLLLLPHTFISNKIYSIGEYGVHLNLNDWGKR